MFTKGVVIVCLCIMTCFSAFHRTDDKDESDRKFHGKWEVVAEVHGDKVDFPMYDSIVLTADSLVLQENGVDGVLGYRKADENHSKDELRIVAWHIDGSADGTPAGTPIFALAMKIKGNRGLARLSFGDIPSDVFKAQKQDEMHSLLFVLKRFEDQGQNK
jgi:hypothetical protein